MMPVNSSNKVQPLSSPVEPAESAAAQAADPATPSSGATASASSAVRAFQGESSFDAGPSGANLFAGRDGLPMVPKTNIVDSKSTFTRVEDDPASLMPVASGEGRSSSTAIQEANSVLLGKAQGATTEQGATVTYAPAASNASRKPADAGRSSAASAHSQANAALEAAQLAGLNPEQQQQYQKVAGLLTDSVARLSLQKQLFEGKLTGGPDLMGQDNVLSGLAKLADQPLAEGLERKDLMSDLVQELGNPASISQGDRGTCAATAVEVKLIHDNPAEYVRLVSGLASPEGQAELASGEMLTRVPGTEADDGTDRSIPQRLMAPAFMDAADGELTYDNANDLHSANGEALSRGLAPEEVDRLLESVYGEKFKNIDEIRTAKQRKAAWSVLQKASARGEEVLAGLTWSSDTRHKVVVTGVSGDNVEYLNPVGRMERMNKDAFLSRLNNLNYASNIA